MKNLIDSLRISHRRFAELYGIPYRTVAAWYTGDRTAPEWVKSLIVQIIELKTKGIQMSIEDIKHKKKCYSVRIETIENEWRTFYSENDIKTAYKEKEFWEAQPRTKKVEIECWEKI